eukprot:6194885-Pleurochrysis_carterae.AAC.1
MRFDLPSSAGARFGAVRNCQLLLPRSACAAATTLVKRSIVLAAVSTMRHTAAGKVHAMQYSIVGSAHPHGRITKTPAAWVALSA